MERKLDLRVVKTHKALMQTFMQLLERKSFEEITVKEICDQALVRRATFYKHFEDKYDFASFVLRELQQHFFEENEMAAHEGRSKGFYLSVLRRTIAFISEHERLIRSILQSNMSSSLMDNLVDEISFTLKLKFKEDEEKGCTLPAEPEILAYFYIGALMQVIRWWMMQKERMSEEQLIQQLLLIIGTAMDGEE